MTCPHFRVKISSRSRNQNAVAQAAYQSGERLYDERSHRTKSYAKKDGIIYTEILLPVHAPPEYEDRNTLWNSMEQAETQWNSQLARRIEIALPVELPLETSIEMLRRYCLEQFVSRGMIADIAVHDPSPPGHNPHAHVMLTMRALDEQGRWLPKCRKEYILDAAGNRIRDGNGRWKSRKIPTTDWDRLDNVEKWRQAWENIQNQYLEMDGHPERVCLKSYERQGKDIAPTFHMGPAAAAMERRGIQTEIGNLNRAIREMNRRIDGLKYVIRELSSWLSGVRAEIAAIQEELKEPSLAELLRERFSQRKEERFLTWEHSRTNSRADQKDLERFSLMANYLTEHDLNTVVDLDKRLHDKEEAVSMRKAQIHEIRKRVRQIEKIEAAAERCFALKPIHDQYIKIHWKLKKEHFYKLHKAELDEWKSCDRFLHANISGKTYYPQVFQEEKEKLLSDLDRITEELKPLEDETRIMKDIRFYVSDLLLQKQREEDPSMPSERSSAERESAGVRASVLNRLREKQQGVGRRTSSRRITSQRRSGPEL